jgi:hypothetical protein
MQNMKINAMQFNIEPCKMQKEKLKNAPNKTC